MMDDKEYNRDKQKIVGLELSQKAYYHNYYRPSGLLAQIFGNPGVSSAWHTHRMHPGNGRNHDNVYI